MVHLVTHSLCVRAYGASLPARSRPGCSRGAVSCRPSSPSSSWRFLARRAAPHSHCCCSRRLLTGRLAPRFRHRSYARPVKSRRFTFQQLLGHPRLPDHGSRLLGRRPAPGSSPHRQAGVTETRRVGGSGAPGIPHPIERRPRASPSLLFVRRRGCRRGGHGAGRPVRLAARLAGGYR